MGYPLECAGPVFCAGITMYSPLKHWGAVKGGKRVGIVGIGGLGQVGPHCFSLILGYWE